MFGVDERNRPHGDEWRWRLAQPRGTPSISVIFSAPSAAERTGASRAFGFARQRSSAPIEPLLWEGD